MEEEEGIPSGLMLRRQSVPPVGWTLEGAGGCPEGGVASPAQHVGWAHVALAVSGRMEAKTG